MKLRITVHGVAYEVDVEVLDAGEGFPGAGPLPRPATAVAAAAPVGPPDVTQPTARPAPRGANVSPGGTVCSPIAGTVLEVCCKAGDRVERDGVLMVIEAMKMETSVAAPTAGTVQSVEVAVGDTVRESQVLVNLE